MSKVMVGSIPKKIMYVYTNFISARVGCEWDINDKNNTMYSTEDVLPTFPVDAENQKSIDTATKWAENYYRYDNKKNIATNDIVDNISIKNIRVLSLETRSEGGRAYKVIIEQNNKKYYVDLREDVLMDCILQCGIKVGGILEGEFIWVKVGSQMKLVRINSELHKMVNEYDSTKNAEKISKKDLEIGGIYQNRKKNKFVFLGYVDTTKFNEVQNTKTSNGYPASSYYTSIIPFKFTEIKISKTMLFYELDNYIQDKENLDKLNNCTAETFSFTLKKNHQLIEKINQVDSNIDYINIVKNIFTKKMKERIKEYLKSSVNYKKEDMEIGISSTTAYYSEFLNMRKYKDPENNIDIKDKINNLKLWI